MAAPDPLAAIVAYVKADSTVNTLVSGRVYGSELPGTEAFNKSMPAATILFIGSGGGSLLGASYLELAEPRIDAFCYGSTPYQAALVSRNLTPLLRQMKRNVKAGALLHWAHPSGGPISSREPGTEWPVCWSAYSVLVSEVTIV